MAQIIPAIVSYRLHDIKEKVNRLEGLASWVHIDVADGKFAMPATWNNPEDLKEIKGKIKIGVHLMIEEPEKILPAWQEVIDRAIVHFESTDELNRIIDGFSDSAVDLVIALELNTPVEKVFPYLNQVPIVHLMSIATIGHGGEPFNDQVLGKIKTLRENFPNVTIQVDGGINLTTGKKAIIAGADILVANSAIWQSADPVETIERFKAL